MVDDLLDVQGDASEMGKPVGKDLIQGVLTLPTILLMEKYPEENPVQALFEDPSHDGKLGRVLEMINNSTIVDECYDVIGDYCAKAAQCLDIIPDSPSRQSLLSLLGYIRERSR